MIIQETTYEKVRKQIQENLNNKKKITFTSDNDDFARKILEKQPIDIFLINLSHRKDSQKQRESGFNQVLARIAKKKNTTIGINLDEIIEAKPKEKAKILARLQQNIKLCNKHKLKMKFIAQKEKNQRNPKDLKSLGLVLGMPTSMVRDL